MNKFKLVFLFSLFTFCAHRCVAQKVDLSKENSAWLNRCDSLLNLGEDQYKGIYLILFDFQQIAEEWELRKNQNNQAPISEMEWEKNDIRLQAEKKEWRQKKEDRIIALLDEKQRIQFYNIISPSKPNVLHMGVNHDRATCIICVKPPTP